LLFVSLLLFQYAAQWKRRWLRFPLLLTVWFGFLGVFFSFSRGSWLGGLVVFLGLVVLYPKVVIRSAVVVGILVLILANTVWLEETSWAAQRLEDESTAEGRIVQYVSASGMISQKPWFGWGYDNYNLHYRHYMTNVGDIFYKKPHSSHNSTLTIMAELGVIGFLLSAIPLIWWLMLSLRAWSRLPHVGFWSRKFLGMLWLLIAHLLIVSCFSDIVSTANPFGVTLYWMVLGLIANLVYPYLKRCQVATSNHAAA
jgi:O-antigen ligase